VSLLFLLACKGDDPSGLGPSVPDDLFEEVWAVDGLSWDLALYGDGLLSTTQFGGQIWGWEPQGGVEEEVGDRLGEVQAVAVDGEDIYFTVTDSGMTGFVALLTGVRTWDELATEGDGGLPIRRPEDMVVGPDGALYIADPGAEALWRVERDGSSAKVVTRNILPLSVAWHDGRLHYGTADAVYAWDDGTEASVEVLDQPGYGLLSDEGSLLVGSQEGIWEDGVHVAATQVGMRVSSMVRVGDVVYFTDQGQGSVWSMER